MTAPDKDKDTKKAPIPTEKKDAVTQADTKAKQELTDADLEKVSGGVLPPRNL